MYRCNIRTVRKRCLGKINKFIDIIDGRYKLPPTNSITHYWFLTPAKLITKKLPKYKHLFVLYEKLDKECKFDFSKIESADRPYLINMKSLLEQLQSSTGNPVVPHNNFKESNILYILNMISNIRSSEDNLLLAKKIDDSKELTTRSKIKLLKAQTKIIGGPKIEPYLTKYLLRYPKQSDYFTYWVYREGQVLYTGINKPDISTLELKNGLVEKKFHAEEYRQAIEEHFETKERELELKLQQELQDVHEDTAKLVQIAKLILRTDNTNIHAVINTTKQIFLELN